jgi:hypothetical protein
MLHLETLVIYRIFEEKDCKACHISLIYSIVMFRNENELMH